MNLQLREKKQLEDAIYEDMKEQFPPAEMKSFNEINRLLADGGYRLDVLFADNEPAGYILFYKSEFLWIDYVAIFKNYQSCGLGSKVLQLFFHKYNDLKGCYFEVEKENSKDINTVRRVNFYKKNGCVCLDFKYYFPNDIKRLEMSLFYKTFNGEIPNSTQIFYDTAELFNALHANIKSCHDTLDLIRVENACPENF